MLPLTCLAATSVTWRPGTGLQSRRHRQSRSPAARDPPQRGGTRVSAHKNVVKAHIHHMRARGCCSRGAGPGC